MSEYLTPVKLEGVAKWRSSAWNIGAVSTTGTIDFDRSYPDCVFPLSSPCDGKKWRPCTACSTSGTYIDYGGPDNPAIAVPCRKCNGKGWILEAPDDLR